MTSNTGTVSDMACCTIVTKSHLAYAQVLAKSLAEHNPQCKMFVLLADRIDGFFDPQKYPFELITLAELKDQKDVQRMCFYYSPSELCFNLRPWLHEYMYQQSKFEKWIYLDSDILICNSLNKISVQLDKTSILLSPHLISIETPAAINVKAVRKLESNLLHKGGIYNGGFLALRKTADSHAFIQWFKDHLRFYGFDNRPLQSGDQFWLTYVPLYFKEVSVLRDPGANLAYWNLYERDIKQDDSGKIMVNGSPLLFFHFAGFDMQSQNKLTKYELPKDLTTVPSSIEKLANKYRRLMLENGYGDSIQYPYAFAKFKTGQTITPDMRRIYFEDLFQGKSSEVSPFERYAYFRSRLSSRNYKDFLKNAAKPLVKHIRKWFNTV